MPTPITHLCFALRPLLTTQTALTSPTKTNMAALSELLLTTLGKREEFDSLTLASELSVEHEKIVGAVKSLQAKGDVCLIAKCCTKCIHVGLHMDDVICRMRQLRSGRILRMASAVAVIMHLI